MALPKGIREKAGLYFLSKEKAPQRERQGVNLSKAKSAALLYVDKDETYFKKIKAHVRDLHDTYGLQRVCALGFVNLPSKELPVYHAQKLEYMYFTKSDLNWHMKPRVSLMNFLSEPFDLLIDLSTELCIPMHYILNASHARMKVGSSLALADRFYDMTFRLPAGCSHEDYWDQVTYYLNKAELK